MGILGFGALLIVTALKPTSANADSCSGLANLSLSNTTITAAENVTAGAFTMPSDPALPPAEAKAHQRFAEAFKDLPEFCRATATIRPVADSETKIEVWMPHSGWNGKFLAVGNGGWAGTINYSGMGQSLRRGYATASTDTGHAGSGGDASFAYGHPEKLIDLGYRSVHLMTVDAKAIIAAFYGNGPRLSYWNGCSTGGKQGLTEAQRYPEDFNAIAAGAPANYWTHLMFATIWPAFADLQDPASHIPPSKYR